MYFTDWLKKIPKTRQRHFTADKYKETNSPLKGAWLVKNSWGGDWGEQGYVWMKKGRNLCGIANEAIVVQF